MAELCVMKKFLKDHRLQADSMKEITHPFEVVTLRLEGRLDRSGRKKVKTGLLLNALAVWFVGQTEDQQLRIAVDALERLHRLIAEPDDERTATAADGDAPSRDAHQGRDVLEPKQPPGRKDQVG
jgi:hypothetical protein